MYPHHHHHGGKNGKKHNMYDGGEHEITSQKTNVGEDYTLF
jgi:hypothetical protein